MKTKRVVNRWTGGAVLAGLSMMSLPALAQDVSNPDSGVAPPSPSEQPAANAGESARQPITVFSGISEQFNTKIKDVGSSSSPTPKPAAAMPGGSFNPTSFSITRYTLGVKAPVKLNDDFTLATSLRYEFDSYNFNGAAAGQKVPWRNINTPQLASILSWRVNDTWTAYGGAFARMSAASDAALGEGFTGGGLMGFNYKVSDTLSLGAGLAIASQIEDHTLFVPIITAKWKFADYWRLDVGLTDVATAGYGAEVKWLFSDTWDFGFGVQTHKSRFRTGTYGEGVGQEKSSTIYADATWHATPKMDVNGFVGMTSGGDLSAYDDSGNKIYGHKYDSAAILGLKGTFSF
jgi:hypothetical protein